ncbi:MAG: glycosyltransferase family 4 protein [Anaerolineae bacterium]|nr:glycosyltransferase family 4 protein [Anaerolineae bacterium]
MRIGVDCTAAARQGGGIGRYTRELMRAALASRPYHDFILMAATAGLGERWAGEVERLKSLAPGRVTARSIPLTDDWMARIWHRLRLPLPATWITGTIDLFYAPDFLLPPLPHKVRKVVTIHDLSFLRHPEAFTPQLRDYLATTVPRSVRRADRVLTDSLWTRQDVIELLDVAPDRVTALHLGVSDAFGPDAAPDERHHLEATYGLGSEPYVLAVGTVQPRKNYRRLIEAIDRVRERVDATLVIAGRPAWLSESIVEAAASRPHVRLLGFVDDGDLPALYRQAGVFAFPSIYEGFGLPPLEAMACGTPVVASSASSIPEAVGAVGLLHDPLDVDGLAQALVRALTDEALRADLRRQGLARAAEATWARTAQEWLAAVQSA